jgi:hypothetical protein
MPSPPPHRTESRPNSPGDADIVLRVDSVDQLFQRFDPAPMEHRRVSDEADAYITARTRELGHAENLRVRILVPPGQESCCAAIQQAFRAHFSAAADKAAKQLRAHFITSSKILLICLAFALALVFLSKAIADWSDTTLMRKVASTLSIAVWVTLWRPIEMLLHDWRPIKARLNISRRLESVAVESRVSE